MPPGIYIEVLWQPSISPKRLKPRSVSTPGAGNPSTPTTRVASPEAQDPVVPATEEALLPPAQVVLLVERTHPPWAQDIVKYMVERVLLEDDHKAERVARQAKLYVLIDGELYRRCENGVKLRFIAQEQGRELLKDIHEGIC